MKCAITFDKPATYSRYGTTFVKVIWQPCATLADAREIVKIVGYGTIRDRNGRIRN